MSVETELEFGITSLEAPLGAAVSGIDVSRAVEAAATAPLAAQSSAAQGCSNNSIPAGSSAAAKRRPCSLE